MTAVSIDLARLERELPQGLDSASLELARETRGMADLLLDRTRDLSLELRPAVLDDFGLVPTLRWYLNTWARRLGIAANLDTRDLGDERLPPRVETTIYRIIQEALMNVARHAGASEVTVSLTYEADSVTVRIEDDGHGFDPEEVVGREPGTRGMGLLNMRERVSFLGGHFRVEANPGDGTRLVAMLPLATEATEDESWGIGATGERGLAP